MMPALDVEAPINRLPLGLLSFFDIKQLGKSPRALLDRVAPVADLREFYLPDSLQVVTGTSGPHVSGTTGYLNILSVPQGETWWLSNWSVRITGLLAAETAFVAPAFAIRDTAGVLTTSAFFEIVGPQAGFSGSAVASAFGLFTDPSHRGRLLPAGWGMGVNLGQTNSAAGITFLGNALVARLRT